MQVVGSTNSHGYSVILESGKRFYANESRAGFYIEPQIQLRYTHQGSSTTKASNGLNIHVAGYNSILTQANAVIGYDVKKGNTPMNLYVKTGYVRELENDANYSLNKSQETQRLRGGWWEHGVGITATFNKQHTLTVEGTYSKGKHFHNTQGSLMYRYHF